MGQSRARDALAEYQQDVDDSMRACVYVRWPPVRVRRCPSGCTWRSLLYTAINPAGEAKRRGMLQEVVWSSNAAAAGRAHIL